jgi:DNA repair exonuclease SbcCD nuclease subunit
MTESTTRFTFLQFSDVLLDAKLTHAGLSQSGLTHSNFSLEKHVRAERARELQEATINAFALAKDQKVDAILIPGGLWDNVTATSRTINNLVEAASSVGNIPIYIAPGHRDFFTRSSLYTNDMLSARGLKPWPENVHVFTSEHFSSVVHPTMHNVCFTGRAITKGARRTERILSGKLPKSRLAAINVGLFAGSLESHPSLINDPLSLEPRKPLIYPFSEDELEAQNLTYAAVGHIKDGYQIFNSQDKLLGAYAGCLAGGSFQELGQRFAILGSIEVEEGGEPNVTLTPQELDVRRMMLVTVDVSGLGDEEIKDEIVINIEDSGVRPDTDVVALNLEGRHKPGCYPKQIAEELSDNFYHLLVVDNTRPDYLAERFDERTTEWKYIEAMLAMKTNAEKPRGREMGSDSLSGLPGADLSGKTVEDALYYGLDALKLKRVIVRNVG